MPKEKNPVLAVLIEMIYSDGSLFANPACHGNRKISYDKVVKLAVSEKPVKNIRHGNGKCTYLEYNHFISLTRVTRPPPIYGI